MHRMTLRAVLGVLLGAGLVLPLAAAARPVTVLGSVSLAAVTSGTETSLADGSVTGFAVIANPGLEKTIVQAIPPYTLPVFIEGETSDTGPRPRILRRNLDTTLVLTNATSSALVVRLTLRGADGTVLGTEDLNLAAHGTGAISVSDLLP